MGCYPDDNLRPNIPNSVETYKAINQFALLVTTEEDVFTALSYYDEIYPNAAAVALAEYVVKACHGKGYRYNQPNELQGMNCFHQTIRNNAPPGPIPNGYYIAPQTHTDYNYIPIGSIHGKESDAIDELINLVQANAPYVSSDAIRVYFENTNKKPFIFTSIGTGADNEPLLGTPNSAPNSTSSIFKFLGKTEKRLGVLKSWVDQFSESEGFLFIDDAGNMPNTISETDKRFRSSPLENAIRTCGYHGIRKRDIVMVGMPLLRPVDREKKQDLFPQIFKVIKTHGPPELNEETGLSVKDNRLNTDTSFVLHDSEDNILGSYENCCYKKVLRARLNECIITEGKYCNLEGKELEEYTEKCMMMYSPVAVEAKFKRTAIQGEIKNTYPESSLKYYTDELANRRGQNGTMPRVTSKDY
jgi:hypothetical protein